MEGNTPGCDFAGVVDSVGAEAAESFRNKFSMAIFIRVCVLSCRDGIPKVCFMVTQSLEVRTSRRTAMGEFAECERVGRGFVIRWCWTRRDGVGRDFNY
jgi:NADPH:quinone reductase-like Zn-dependent oxidoreductase